MTDVMGRSGRKAPADGDWAALAWRCDDDNWLTGLLWVLSFAAHFGIDFLIDPHNPNGGLAGSTILLYLAVTYTVQRLIMQARAQRLPASNDRVGSLTSHRF
jgi:hypothetical protein